MAIIKKTKTISKSKSKTKSNSNSNSRKHVNKFRKSSSKTRKMRGGSFKKPHASKVHEVGPPKGNHMNSSHSLKPLRHYLGSPPPIPKMKKGAPMSILPMTKREEDQKVTPMMSPQMYRPHMMNHNKNQLYSMHGEKFSALPKTLLTGNPKIMTSNFQYQNIINKLSPEEQSSMKSLQETSSPEFFHDVMKQYYARLPMNN